MNQRKKKWEPKIGERFWYLTLTITSLGCFKAKRELSYDIKHKYVFKTNREALAAMKRIKKVLEDRA